MRQFLAVVMAVLLLSTAAFSFQNNNCATNAPALPAFVTTASGGAMANPMQFTPAVMSSSAGGEPAVVAMTAITNNPDTTPSARCSLVAQRSMPLKMVSMNLAKVGAAANVG